MFLTLDARDFSCAVSGFGEVLKSDLAASTLVSSAEGRPSSSSHTRKKSLVPRVDVPVHQLLLPSQNCLLSSEAIFWSSSNEEAERTFPGPDDHLLSSCALARHRLSRRPSLSLPYDYTYIPLVRVQIIYNINIFSVEIKDVLIVPFTQLLIYL